MMSKVSVLERCTENISLIWGVDDLKSDTACFGYANLVSAVHLPHGD